ncbi:MAG TPA: hypothetical protein VLD57_09655 [Blastocatellia bacterium]|nr:hypothetical protein [Blastocatellia bacterium]
MMARLRVDDITGLLDSQKDYLRACLWLDYLFPGGAGQPAMAPMIIYGFYSSLSD